MITAAQVKELRTLTGAGILDAKTALTETGGDIASATDWLRAKGMAKAAKKSSRETAEGLVGIRVDGNNGTIIEVNSETDFVARNSNFCDFVNMLLEESPRADDVEGLLQVKRGGHSLSELVTEQIAKIGENLTVRRMKNVSGEHLAGYVHNSVGNNLGKIAVLVSYDGQAGDIGRQIAMHIAASNPIALSPDDVPAELVKRESQVLKQKAIDAGKPENIADRIVEGGLRKFMAEETLLNQKFVMDPTSTIADVSSSAGIKVTGFVRYQVGESL